MHRDDTVTHLAYRTGLKKHTTIYKHNPEYPRLKTLFKIMPRIDSSIVFAGNSLTRDCNWAEFFQNPRIRVRGIGGDCAAGILERIDEILTPPPQKIFFEIGVSDLGDYYTPEEILRNYEKIIDTSRARSPGVGIFLQSLLPLSEELAPPTNKEIVQFNKEIVALAHKKGCVFIDLHPLFVNSAGTLDTVYSNDGVHLNGRAYAKWKQAIERYVR